MGILQKETSVQKTFSYASSGHKLLKKKKHRVLSKKVQNNKYVYEDKMDFYFFREMSSVSSASINCVSFLFILSFC